MVPGGDAGPAGPVDPAPADPGLADLLLDGAGVGVLACDDRGVVRRANPALQELLPEVREQQPLPGALARALTGRSVELHRAGRPLTARRQELPGGWTAWHVEDLSALHAERARTRDLVGVLERSLRQPALPCVAGLEFGAAYRPAEEGLLIGGDFYDAQPAADGSVMLALGDVCGKGVRAAVSTGRLRQSIQALRRLDRDPVSLLRLLNDTMVERTDPACDPGFATMVLGTATPDPAGGIALELAGGGHLPPLVVRRAGVEEIEIGGMLVGAVPAARFRSRRVWLAPGEALVLYTDGITEARGGPTGGRNLGEERLAELLAGAVGMSAPAIAALVEEHTTRWLASGPHDDIAVLVVRAPA